MFTGLINAVCLVRVVGLGSPSPKLVVDLADLAKDIKLGDSVGVNGACLTAISIDGAIVGFDVSGETLGRTALSELRSGSQVNIELAMSAAGRFGGHFVQGHVDGVATVKNIKEAGEFVEMSFAVPAELIKGVILKGSVAVDGVSLTVSALDKNLFSISLIPATLRETTMGKMKIGQAVNIETDLIVKAVQAQLGNMFGSKRKLTIERLREMGY